MRLLIVSLNGDPLCDLGTEHGGGQVKYILELGKNLVGRGWEIDVVTLGSKHQFAEEEITEKFRVLRVFRKNGKKYGYDISIEEIREIVVKLELTGFSLNSYDVVLAAYWLSACFISFFSETKNCPWIITFCQLGIFKKAEFDSPDIGIRIEMEKRACNLFDRIIATNSAEKDALVQNYKANANKITIIPRGVYAKDMFNEF